MKNKLLYKLRSGKNPKFIYYSVNALRLIIPKGIFRLRLQGKLSSLSRRKDKEYIEHRVDYYNKLSGTVQLPSSAPHLSEHKMSKTKKCISLILINIPAGFLISFSGVFVPVM